MIYEVLPQKSKLCKAMQINFSEKENCLFPGIYSLFNRAQKQKDPLEWRA